MPDLKVGNDYDEAMALLMLDPRAKGLTVEQQELVQEWLRKFYLHGRMAQLTEDMLKVCQVFNPAKQPVKPQDGSDPA